MQHNWAKNFVNFMGAIVPMVDGLENIRSPLSQVVLPYSINYLFNVI
jgi:hypothetical protein